MATLVRKEHQWPITGRQKEGKWKGVREKKSPTCECMCSRCTRFSTYVWLNTIMAVLFSSPQVHMNSSEWIRVRVHQVEKKHTYWTWPVPALAVIVVFIESGFGLVDRALLRICTHNKSSKKQSTFQNPKKVSTAIAVILGNNITVALEHNKSKFALIGFRVCLIDVRCVQPVTKWAFVAYHWLKWSYPSESIFLIRSFSDDSVMSALWLRKSLSSGPFTHITGGDCKSSERSCNTCSPVHKWTVTQFLLFWFYKSLQWT